jgi:hypothetical protein
MDIFIINFYPSPHTADKSGRKFMSQSMFLEALVKGCPYGTLQLLTMLWWFLSHRQLPNFGVFIKMNKV